MSGLSCASLIIQEIKFKKDNTFLQKPYRINKTVIKIGALFNRNTFDPRSQNFVTIATEFICMCCFLSISDMSVDNISSLIFPKCCD